MTTVGKLWVLNSNQCTLLGIDLGKGVTLYQSTCRKYWWGHKDPHPETYNIGETIYPDKWIALRDGPYPGVGWDICAQHIKEQTLGPPTKEMYKYSVSLHTLAEITIKK